VALPSSYTFTTGYGGDNGVHIFPGGVALITTGDRIVTATDKASGITGNALITVGGGSAAPPSHRTGRPASFASNIISAPIGDRQAGPDVVLVDRLFRLPTRSLV
jgi:hypothetical protein